MYKALLTNELHFYRDDCCIAEEFFSEKRSKKCPKRQLFGLNRGLFRSLPQGKESHSGSKRQKQSNWIKTIVY